MATNSVQPGNSIEVTLSSSINAGEARQFGDLIGVAAVDGESGDTITFYTEGVFDLPKYTDGVGSTDDSIDQGQTVYWDSSDGSMRFDDDSGTDDPGGKAWEDAADGASTVKVKINA